MKKILLFLSVLFSLFVSVSYADSVVNTYTWNVSGYANSFKFWDSVYWLKFNSDADVSLSNFTKNWISVAHIWWMPTCSDETKTSFLPTSFFLSYFYAWKLFQKYIVFWPWISTSQQGCSNWWKYFTIISIWSNWSVLSKRVKDFPWTESRTAYSNSNEVAYSWFKLYIYNKAKNNKRIRGFYINLLTWFSFSSFSWVDTDLHWITLNDNTVLYPVWNKLLIRKYSFIVLNSSWFLNSYDLKKVALPVSSQRFMTWNSFVFSDFPYSYVFHNWNLTYLSWFVYKNWNKIYSTNYNKSLYSGFAFDGGLFYWSDVLSGWIAKIDEISKSNKTVLNTVLPVSNSSWSGSWWSGSWWIGSWWNSNDVVLSYLSWLNQVYWNYFKKDDFYWWYDLISNFLNSETESAYKFSYVLLKKIVYWDKNSKSVLYNYQTNNDSNYIYCSFWKCYFNGLELWSWFNTSNITNSFSSNSNYRVLFHIQSKQIWTVNPHFNGFVRVYDIKNKKYYVWTWLNDIVWFYNNWWVNDFHFLYYADVLSGWILTWFFEPAWPPDLVFKFNNIPFPYSNKSFYSWYVLKSNKFISSGWSFYWNFFAYSSTGSCPVKTDLANFYNVDIFGFHPFSSYSCLISILGWSAIPTNVIGFQYSFTWHNVIASNDWWKLNDYHWPWFGDIIIILFIFSLLLFNIIGMVPWWVVNDEFWDSQFKKNRFNPKRFKDISKENKSSWWSLSDFASKDFE